MIFPLHIFPSYSIDTIIFMLVMIFSLRSVEAVSHIDVGMIMFMESKLRMLVQYENDLQRKALKVDFIW